MGSACAAQQPQPLYRLTVEQAAILGYLSLELDRGESYASVVVGGSNDVAAGQDVVVGGGSGRAAVGDQDWVAGSLFEDD